jgi:hypothetical protein
VGFKASRVFTIDQFQDEHRMKWNASDIHSSTAIIRAWYLLAIQPIIEI